MKNRQAFSLIEVKAFDEEKREISGVATTPAVDSYGDEVMPDGAEFDLPIPLLWQHSHDKPIGHVVEAKVSGGKIHVKAKLAKVEESGSLRDRLEEAWQSIKHGLVRGLSIGFKPIEWEPIETGIKFTKWAWLELSAVTIPANEEASIELVRAASGHKAPHGRVRPGSVSLAIEENGMNISEQIAALKEKRDANRRRMESLAKAAADEGRTMDDAEGEEYDGLSAENKTVERDLTRLSQLEERSVESARPVLGDTRERASESRAGVRISAPDEKLEAGISFARLARCYALAKVDDGFESPRHAARSLYGENSKVYGYMQQRANVPAGSVDQSTWGDYLVGDETDVFADYVEFLRPQTIIGKFGQNGIPALRNAPFNVPLISQTSGATAHWVEEGSGKPLTKFDGARTTLEPLTVAALSAATKQLLRRSSPSADRLIRDELTAALVAAMDTAFVDQSGAGGSGVPTSILYAAAQNPITSSGCDADAIRCDLDDLFGKFIDADNPITSGVFIMPAKIAMKLWTMRNPLGQREFPDMSMTGGIFNGFPVIASQHMAADSVALVNASDIWLGDEDSIDVSISQDASLEMVDNPNGSSTSPTAAQLVSMFQTNSVAFRVEREINWKLRRSSAVALLSGVEWGCCPTDDNGDPGNG